MYIVTEQLVTVTSETLSVAIKNNIKSFSSFVSYEGDILMFF